MAVTKNDVVQADPATSDWGPAFVIVEEVRSWGIIGYTPTPKSGGRVAHVRLEWDQFMPVVGGQAAFIGAPTKE
jgi:hypothetical protein